MKTIHRPLVLLAILLGSSGMWHPVRASTADTAGPGPVLNGHLFQPMVGVPNPFIITSSQVSVGAGQTLGLELPIISIGDRIVVAPKGDLAIISMVAGHEQRIKEWLSIYGAVRVVGRLGTNVTSLLSQGVNAMTAFSLGWKVKAIETSDFIGTMSLDLNNGNISTVDVERFLRGVIDSNAIVSENPLVDTKPSMTAGVTARAAWAINQAFGLQGFLGGIYGESGVRGGEPGVFLDAGLSFNTDLRPLLDVPIALTLAQVYRETPSIEDAEASQAVTTTSLRVSYSGTQHFAIGLQLSGQFATIEETRTAFFIGAGLDMRFYY